MKHHNYIFLNGNKVQRERLRDVTYDSFNLYENSRDDYKRLSLPYMTINLFVWKDERKERCIEIKVIGFDLTNTVNNLYSIGYYTKNEADELLSIINDDLDKFQQAYTHFSSLGYFAKSPFLITSKINSSIIVMDKESKVFQKTNISISDSFKNLDFSLSNNA